nr:hypothetical protein [uncultured bacterium]
MAQRSTREARQASPPTKMVWRSGSSAYGRAARTEGGKKAAVMRRSARSRTSAGPGTRSLGSRTWSVAPVARPMSVSKREASQPTAANWVMRSPGPIPKARCISSTRAARAAWSTRTPLGRPVEPDVYSRYARSPGTISGRETSAGAPSVPSRSRQSAPSMDVLARTVRGRASWSTRSRRPAGWSGSRGRYTAPARRMARKPTTTSAERSLWRPTTSPVRTPWATRRCARRRDRASRSPYVSAVVPQTTAGASGRSTAWRRTASCASSGPVSATPPAGPVRRSSPSRRAMRGRAPAGHRARA